VAEKFLEQAEVCQRYRNYLRVVAEARLDYRLRGQIDASDLVQQTLLQAHLAWHQYRGSSDEELVAWLRRILLRQILLRQMLHLMRDLQREKREVRRERSLQDAIGNSTQRLEAWLAIDQASPSQRVMQVERAVAIAQAVQSLPDAQRNAVILYYWQGLTLSQIAEYLGRTVPSVAGLIHRGLKQIRSLLSTMGDSSFRALDKGVPSA
jgi:RNA polymerase sigma-70 factor (ECF subfamily)